MHANVSQLPWPTLDQPPFVTMEPNYDFSDSRAESEDWYANINVPSMGLVDISVLSDPLVPEVASLVPEYQNTLAQHAHTIQPAVEPSYKWNANTPILFEPERVVADSNKLKAASTQPTKQFACELCAKTFTRRESMKNHVSSVHQRLKPYKCQYAKCTHEYSTPSDLRRHVREKHLRNAEKLFICQGRTADGNLWGCGKRFHRSYQLTGHWKSNRSQRKCHIPPDFDYTPIKFRIRFRSCLLKIHGPSARDLAVVAAWYRAELKNLYILNNSEITLILPMFRAVARSPLSLARTYATGKVTGQFTGKPGPDGKYTVTMIPGDGIGPEIAASVEAIFKEAKVPITWEPVDVTPSLINGKTTLPADAVASINKNLVALKGPLATPVGKGHQSMNLTLRRTFALFANVRPCKSVQGYKTPYENVDTVLIRENTEGEYSGIEHEIVPGVVQSIKLITKPASERVIRYAFEYAKSVNKPEVRVVHKASIMKLSDGLFVETAKEVGKEYPDIKLSFELLDNTSLKLCADPSEYKSLVMVMPNLYGDIMSDLSSGLIGGLGLTPSGNMGNKVSIFEAVHGSAPDIAGKGLANPTALLLSSCMMLRHMELNSHADKIEDAVLKTIASGPENRTRDLKGTSSTSHFTEQVIKNL
ncbi:hypothetical protein KL910_000899 [Ogataea haglerorum]|nr:hypothetical protein KL910_000899 [Ogataea haglerorum]KAG7793055.1 hypothetical protein KL945_000160 [Ogataea haglerorum]